MVVKNADFVLSCAFAIDQIPASIEKFVPKMCILNVTKENEKSLSWFVEKPEYMGREKFREKLTKKNI